MIQHQNNYSRHKDLQLLMFDKRMKFNSPDGRSNDKITFSISYYCWNFLPKQIIMEELCISEHSDSSNYNELKCTVKGSTKVSNYS